MITGIDVSRWQGAVNWQTVARQGARFAWIKATEGSTWTDPRFAENAAGAAAAGLLWGPYHYFRNGVDPLAQAEHLARVVGGRRFTLPAALDFEDTTGTVDARAMRRFCEAVEQLLGRPVIYTGAWWWTVARLGGPQPWAARYPLWVADYSGPVSVPADWPGWTIHQWTSSADGRAWGVESDRLDLNHYAGTIEHLRALYTPPAPRDGPDLGELVAAAERVHREMGITLNPDAALQRAIRADGLTPTIREGEYHDASGEWLYQRAEGLTGGGAVLYYVKRGDWGNVRKVQMR